MKTIAEYCQQNILVIPEALYGTRDVSVVLKNGNSTILFKSLTTDLTNIEFYTNMPCFVCIQSGSETITTCTDKSLQLTANTVAFLPKGLNLHSDYFNTEDTLKAHLVFFDKDIIEEFLSSQRKLTASQYTAAQVLKIEGGDELNRFFTSIHALSKKTSIPPELVKIKLLEFLHLLALSNKEVCFPRLLSSAKTLQRRRNISRLMNNLNGYQLSVNDLAHLSGRNISSFNRDFKAIYQVAPKQWLQQKRLKSAHHCLLNTDLTVTQVALDFGYENVSHFIKSFKEKFKVTPKQLKQSN